MPNSQKTKAVLRDVAAALSGKVIAGADGPDQPAVVATIGRVPVTLALGAKTGRQKWAVAVTAEAEGAGGLVLKLYPEGFGAQMGKLFGAQDVEVGESRFDDRYMIKASDEALAKLWLDYGLRKQIARAHPATAEGAWLLELTDGKVAMEWAGAVGGARRLEAAMAAVGALADRSAAIMAEWEKIAVALDGTFQLARSHWSPGAQTAFTVIVGDAAVTVDHEILALESKQPTLHVRMQCRRRGGATGRALICRPNAQRRAMRLMQADGFAELSSTDRDLSFNYWVGADSTEVLAGRLKGDLRKDLLEALPEAIAIDDVVTVYVEGFRRKTGRLRQALGLTVALSDEASVVGKGGKRRESVGRSERGRERERERGRGRATAARRTPSNIDEQVGDIGQRLGGREVSARGGRWGRAVEVEVEGVPLRAESYHVVDAPPRLQISAPVPGAEGLTLGLAQGHVDPLQQAFGVQDIEVGEHGFDDRFVIKASDEWYARMWLSPEIRSLILSTYSANSDRGYQYRLRNERLQITTNFDRNSERVLRALRAAAALSSRGRDIVDECRRVAAALGGSVVGNPQLWRPDTGVSMTLEQVQSAVVIGQQLSTTLSRKPTLLTHLRRPRATAGGDRYLVCKHDHKRRGRKLVGAKLSEVAEKTEDVQFAFLYWAGCEDSEATEARLTEGMQRRMVLIDLEMVAATDLDVAIWIRGFVSDVDRLQLALRVMSDLGEAAAVSGPAGPYR